MKKVFRIGTRESPLALWQAHKVAAELKKLGHLSEIIPVTSAGDIELTLPLYEMGITGIFTKNLDIALLQNRIDLAVHSLKDVPTLLPKGIVLAGVLKRAAFDDVLIYKNGHAFDKSLPSVIATGSLRRKAQWLHKYPHHEVVNLRGNVNTRLQKLKDNPWQGAVFAKAGLERIGVLPNEHKVLDWMLPAPAQGIVGIATRAEDADAKAVITQINHEPSMQSAKAERDFLNTLEGGCTAPIGALARIEGDTLHFKGALFETDGSDKIEWEGTFPITDYESAGKSAAHSILKIGGDKILENIKRQLTKNQ